MGGGAESEVYKPLAFLTGDSSALSLSRCRSRISPNYFLSLLSTPGDLVGLGLTTAHKPACLKVHSYCLTAL